MVNLPMGQYSYTSILETAVGIPIVLPDLIYLSKTGIGN